MKSNNTGLNFNFFVFKEKLPENEFSFLNSITGKLLSSNRQHDVSNRLPAVFTNGDQIKIPNKVFPKSLETLIIKYAEKYIEELSSNMYTARDINPISYWIVSQRNNDFNPMHSHNGKLSGIIYLNVPEDVADINSASGKISFLFDKNHPWSLHFHGVQTVTPSPGDIYLFPSWLPHCVYPFEGEGERRSVAFNFDLNVVSK